MILVCIQVKCFKYSTLITLFVRIEWFQVLQCMQDIAGEAEMNS